MRIREVWNVRWRERERERERKREINLSIVSKLRRYAIEWLTRCDDCWPNKESSCILYPLCVQQGMFDRWHLFRWCGAMSAIVNYTVNKTSSYNVASVICSSARQFTELLLYIWSARELRKRNEDRKAKRRPLSITCSWDSRRRAVAESLYSSLSQYCRSSTWITVTLSTCIVYKMQYAYQHTKKTSSC